MSRTILSVETGRRAIHAASRVARARSIVLEDRQGHTDTLDLLLKLAERPA
jgi:hypothetical protein